MTCVSPPCLIAREDAPHFAAIEVAVAGDEHIAGSQRRAEPRGSSGIKKSAPTMYIAPVNVPENA